jgi:hypothetical protein
MIDRSGELKRGRGEEVGAEGCGGGTVEGRDNTGRHRLRCRVGGRAGVAESRGCPKGGRDVFSTRFVDVADTFCPAQAEQERRRETVMVDHQSESKRERGRDRYVRSESVCSEK